MLTPKKLVLALLGASVLLAAPVVPPSVAYAADEEVTPTDTSAVDEALDLYWAKKRKVVSIHERRFLKQSRHEFTLFGGVIPNDEFYTYIPLGGRYNYYFNEDIGAEVWGSYILKRNSDLKDFLEGDQFNNSFVVSIPQNLLWMAGVDVIWSPIHGKFAIFKTKLTHFDVHLAFGVGAIGTQVRQIGADKTKVDVSGNLGLGFRFYLNDIVTLRFDYRQYFFSAEGGGLSKPAEFTLGVSFWTASPK